MTTEDAVKILAILKAAYPNNFKGMTKEEATGTINIWASQFSNISAFIVMLAVNKHISSNKFPPTVSEIKDKIKNLYYETVESLSLHKQGIICLDDKKVNTLKEVKREVEQYRGDNPIEPSLNELLDGYTKLLIGKPIVNDEKRRLESS